jgi:plasmid stabilization system protein ParE
MKVVLHAAALRELAEAKAWYEARGAPEYGVRLVERVDRRLVDLGERPESFPRDPQRAWARRARLLRTAYTLVFVVHAGQVLVLAFAHEKRRPGYWGTREPTAG